MNIIKRLFGKGEEGTGELLCPYCERAMGPDHKCTAMTRRFFFGSIVAAGAVAAIPVLKVEAPVVSVRQLKLISQSWVASNSNADELIAAIKDLNAGAWRFVSDWSDPQAPACDA